MVEGNIIAKTQNQKKKHIGGGQRKIKVLGA
jgi:hypothetical protein